MEVESEDYEPSVELLAELEEASTRLDEADPVEIVEWTVNRFPGRVALAASFQDAALLDMAVRVDPAIEVIFLDTGFHFPETLAYVERLRRRYDLNLVVTHPEISPDEFPCGSSRCCELRKVAPLAKALQGRSAWITGLKRVDTPERATAPVIAWDPRRKMVKVNPVAAWTTTTWTRTSRPMTCLATRSTTSATSRSDALPRPSLCRRAGTPARAGGRAPPRPNAGCTYS